MITKLYCPVAGLEIDTEPDWSDRKVSAYFTVSFCTLGNSIILSKPRGRTDIQGVRKALSLNREITEKIKVKRKSYVQIEDYASLDSSSQEARKCYINSINDTEGLLSLIFCNVSPSIALAIKIGNRFITAGRKIQICSDYPQAVKLAIDICNENNIPIDTDNMTEEFTGIGNSSSLVPLKLSTSPELLIETDNLKDPIFVMDDNILFSKPEGVLMKEHLSTLNLIWQKLRPIKKSEPGIEYIMTDASELEGFQSSALRPYGKLLRTLNKFDPIQMHIMYNASDKIRHASKVANSFMPFEIRTADDLKEAYSLIQQNKKHKNRQRQDTEQTKVTNKVLEFLNEIDWSKPGIEIPVSEDNPDFVLMNAIKLIKEETDSLFQENKQKETEIQRAAEEKQQLLRELQHRVKNSFFLIKSMIFMKKKANLTDETLNILNDLEHSLNAISGLYELLDDNRGFKDTSLDVYLSQLIKRYSSAQNKVKFEMELEKVEPPTDQIVPIGLIVS